MAQRENSRYGNDRGAMGVLVTRFSAVGDVAMTIPVVYSACRCYPDVRFVMVTRSKLAQMFVNAPANLVVIGADIAMEHFGWKWATKLTAKLIDDYGIDLMVDLQGEAITWFMALACRMRGVKVWRIDQGSGHKRRLTRRSGKEMLPLPSQRARFRQVFFNAGLPVVDRFSGLYEGHCKADPQLFASITGSKLHGEHWVGIAPFAAYKGKIYPTEQMYEVVKMLARQGGVRIFLLGAGRKEQSLVDSWAAEMPCAMSLAGKGYGLAAELALMNHMDCVLTMDSANMHLAALAGAPVVSIWGATHSYCGFRGWHQRDDDMVQLPLSCRPCSVVGDKPCYRGDYLCLSGIKPEVIYKRVCEKFDKDK